MKQQTLSKDPPFKTITTFKQDKELLTCYQNIVLDKFYQNFAFNGKVKPKNAHGKHLHILSKNQSKKDADKLAPEGQNETENSMYKTRSIFLPSLNNKQGNYKQKIIVNDTIYIHERLPFQVGDKTQRRRKRLVIEEDGKKGPEPKVQQSLRKINDLQIVEIHVKNPFKESPKRVHKKHKSNQKLYKIESEQTCPIIQTSKKIKIFPKSITIDVNQTSHPEIHREANKFEKMIREFKHNKKHEGQIFTQKNIMITTFGNQKIKVQGEHKQTEYLIKKKKKHSLKLQRSSSSLQKAKFVSWKARQFQIKQASKIEVNRLLSFYLFIREVVSPQNGYYRVYVGQGNNGQLITRLLKNKGWWLPTDDIKEAHLIWTQLPNEEHMKKIQSHELIKLKQVTNSVQIDKQSYRQEKEAIARFLKVKENSFFNACQKLLHPLVYHKTMVELINKFKDNRYIKNYAFLKDVISHLYNINNESLLKVDCKNLKVVNHCEYSNEIGDKKALFYHIQHYCLINQIDKHTMIPQTVHINQQEIVHFKSNNSQSLIQDHLALFTKEQALFILKPGECSNRGQGITVHPNKSALIQHISTSLISFPENKTYIVQQYIDPLLYEGRKFDIRVWALYSNNKIWFYRQGYVRTSCKEFTIKSMNKYIHLTNDAVQKYSEQYGKYEPANKVSFNDLDKYLKKHYNYQAFYSEIYENIKVLTKRLFQVGNNMIGRSSHQFQLFGLDFLIDKNFKVWLIECNTNPSIEICCSLLNRLVPNMIENLFTITVDPFFPPVQRKAIRQENEWCSQKFNFELLLDNTFDNSFLEKVAKQNQEYFDVLKGINSFKLDSYEHNLTQ